MKALRFVLVLAFMFTLAVSPAQAQAGEQVGFIPLVTQLDPAISFHEQSQQAFHRLLPQLLAAKKSGAILDFAPEFEAGILKIKYAGRVNRMTLGTTQALDDINDALALVPHQQPARANPEVLTPTFYPNLYSSCFSAYGLGNASRVVGSLRDKAGVIVSSVAGAADTSGYLSACFDWTGNNTILPGYTLLFKVYNSTGVTLLGTYTAMAPSVTFTTINNATSVVGGTGPANKPYSIYWKHQNMDAGDTYLTLNKTGTISAAYQWQVDFGTVPLRGGDYLSVAVDQNANFTFQRSLNAPSYAYCVTGGNYCGIYGFPFQAASITIAHAGVPRTFTGKFNAGGWFDVELEDASGNPIFLVGGDAVAGTGVAPYFLPKLTAIPNFTTNVVSGLSPANKYFRFHLYDLFNNNSYSTWTHSNASGIYSINFTPTIDLKATDVVRLEVYYKDPANGNTTDRSIAVGP